MLQFGMETLKSIRKGLKLTAEQVVAEGRRIDPRFPSTPHAIYVIESRGTDTYSVLKVLAQIYGRDIEELSRLAASPPVVNFCNISA